MELESRKVTSQQNQDYNLKGKLVPKTCDELENGGEINQQIILQEKNKKLEKTKHWTARENKIYLNFLLENAHLFRYKSTRRTKQVYNLLSERMDGIKTAAQCKSHHQKMKKATDKGTIKQIVSYVKHKKILKKNSQKPIKIQKDQKNEKNNKSLDYQIKLEKKYGKICHSISINIDNLFSW